MNRRFGVCWRQGISHALASAPEPEWLEANTEDLIEKPAAWAGLERALAGRPLALHGVSLSIGSTDPLSERYLNGLKALIDRFTPLYVSDHLCWSSLGGSYVHDLLPLPNDRQTLHHVAARVSQVQDRLRRPVLLENISRYVAFADDSMHEWELLKELARQTGCGLLLDVNNLYVNAVNVGEQPVEWLRGLAGAPVEEFHLAGYRASGRWLIDTHDQPVSEQVWDLYRQAVQCFPSAATAVEWDGALPTIDPLIRELSRARIESDRALCGARPIR